MIANTNHLFFSDFVTRQLLNIYLPGSFASGDGHSNEKTKSGPSFTFFFKKFSMNSLKLLNLFQNSNMVKYCYVFCNDLVLQSLKIEYLTTTQNSIVSNKEQLSKQRHDSSDIWHKIQSTLCSK